MEGRCTCGAVRYRLASPPLFTHCCHCRWCQRQTGSACVVNAMIETDRIQLLTGQPEMISIPSPSGMGQTVARCPTCKIALWSSYTIAGDKIRFVRACTLDDSDALPPSAPYFHRVQTAVDGPAPQHSFRPRILPHRRLLAGGEYSSMG